MNNHTFLKDKNYLLLFFGKLVSGIGSRVYGFGIGLYLLDLTGLASSLASYISIWAVVLFIAGPIAATFTDRWSNKVRVLYLTDYGRGFAYLLIALGVWYFNNLGNTEMVMLVIYTGLVVIGIQTAFFNPASVALIPQLVDGDELVSASSIMQITRSVQNILGLSLGALLYITIGIVPLMIINGCSFLLSAFSEMFIRFKVPKNIERIEKEKETLINEEKTVGALAYIKRIYNDLFNAVKYMTVDAKPILMITFIILISTTLGAPWFSIGVPYMLKQYFTFADGFKPEYILASAEFAEGIGIILLSLVVSAIAVKYKIYQLIRIGASLFVLLGTSYFIIVYFFDIELFATQTFVYTFVALNFVAGGINAIVNAPLDAAMQKYIDPSKIGKVGTLMDTFGSLLFPVTALLAGLMIDNISMYIPMFMMIFGMLLITFISFRSKELKKLI